MKTEFIFKSNKVLLLYKYLPLVFCNRLRLKLLFREPTFLGNWTGKFKKKSLSNSSARVPLILFWVRAAKGLSSLVHSIEWTITFPKSYNPVCA